MTFENLRTRALMGTATLAAHPAMHPAAWGRMQRAWVLAAGCLAGPVQAAEPTLARNLAANCTSCHAANANAGGMPSLAGQPQPALLAALRAFRDGTRPATVMHQLARGYTDQQLEVLAAFFAALPRPEGS